MDNYLNQRFIGISMFSFALGVVFIMSTTSTKIFKRLHNKQHDLLKMKSESSSTHHQHTKHKKNLSSVSSRTNKGSFLLKPHDNASITFAVLEKYKSELLVLQASNHSIDMIPDNLGKQLIKNHNESMGPNVSLFYKDDGGLVITNGKGVYMIDIKGNYYLDCCNNVACCGHSHPHITQVGINSLQQIQINSRFLHPIRYQYVEKLLATFPKELNTVYLVNSGTEANDLALRMARAYTTAKCSQDVIVLDSAYHGHSQSLVDISPYKWYQAVDGKNYQPDTTHVVSCPDSYRGLHRGFTEATGLAYAKEVEEVIARTGGVGTFIAESVVGCGGQIMLPPGYLKACYTAVRASGGVCIADEVQTGFGRAGNHFWMFQKYGEDVIPDIVTVGKPMGNGYPVAAVICRREVADAFASTGIEYFNTYGGNSVACSIAEAVLDTIHTEQLQSNAKTVGEYMTAQLTPLMGKYKWVGDIRGIGLFQGIEFVKNNYYYSNSTESSSSNNNSNNSNSNSNNNSNNNSNSNNNNSNGSNSTNSSNNNDGNENNNTNNNNNSNHINNNNSNNNNNNDNKVLEPFPELTKFIVDVLRLNRVVVSRDGPNENVIKIKPPLVFSKDNVDELVRGIEVALDLAIRSNIFPDEM